MNSTLLGLPNDVKGFIYFDALSHIASSVIALPMSESVKKISIAAVQNLDTDVMYLQNFVQGLNEPLLVEVFEELGQTINLLQSDNADEFYSIDTRMKKYANVNPLTGPMLLEKLVQGEQVAVPVVPKTGLSRFR